MKVSLTYVFIAASIVAATIASESNPHHRYLKAKSTKVSKSSTTKSSKRASKSKSAETVDLCTDVVCLTTPEGCIGSCNENTGECQYGIAQCTPTDPNAFACTDTPEGLCVTSGKCLTSSLVQCPPGSCQRPFCNFVDGNGCNVPDNTNNNGACSGTCCSGDCCPEDNICVDGACTLEPECTADTVEMDCSEFYSADRCILGACNTDDGVCITLPLSTTNGDQSVGCDTECCEGVCCPEDTVCENGTCTSLPETTCIMSSECSDLDSSDGCMRGVCNNALCESVTETNGNPTDGCATECCEGECCAEGEVCQDGQCINFCAGITCSEVCSGICNVSTGACEYTVGESCQTLPECSVGTCSADGLCLGVIC